MYYEVHTEKALDESSTHIFPHAVEKELLN